MPGEVYRPPVRHQGAQEGRHYRQGRGDAHTDGEQGTAADQPPLPDGQYEGTTAVTEEID